MKLRELYEKVIQNKASPEEVAEYLKISQPLWEEVKELKSSYRRLVKRGEKAEDIRRRLEEIYFELTGRKGDFNLDRDLCG